MSETTTGWYEGKLGDVVELKRGYDLPAQHRLQGTVPIASSSGPSGFHNQAMAKAPGVVTGRYGTLGEVFFLTEDYWPLNTTLYVRDFKGNDPKFVSYFLKGIDFLSCSDKAAVPGVNRNHLHQLPVTTPPIPEQRAIAHVLGTLDDKIELNRKMNETLEAMARALFNSWFVDFDPVRAKMERRRPAGMDAETAALFPSSFVDSEMGEIPKGWEVRPVGEMVEGIYDGPHATPPESDSGPIFLGIKNLTGAGLNLSDLRHISEDSWKQWTRRITPKSGDIVFSYEATLGFFALIPRGIRCCLGRRLALIRPKIASGFGHFWFHQFISAPFQRFLEQHFIHGATVNRIPLIEFPSYPVTNPPDALKSLFEFKAASLWERNHASQSESRTLATLRDALLPKLLSGELRIPEAEKMVEVAT